MDVNAVDLVIILTVVTGVWVGYRRGFGKTLFDFVALIVGLRIASSYYVSLSNKYSLVSDISANEAIIFSLAFVVVSGVLWYIGKLIYDATLISLDTFDPPLGGMLGFGAAVIVGHAIVKSLYISASVGGSVPEVVAHSTLGFEFLRFPTYHLVVDVLLRLGQ